jgi:N-acetylmuramoyl-L-alanine amidase
MSINLSDPVSVVAATLWGEARNQGYAGMVAVGCVIRNRALSPRWWGSSYITVCLEPYQFSCWNDSDPNRAKLLAVTTADPQFAEALKIAALVISGHAIDPTHNSDSYYSDTMDPPSWCEGATFTVQIGAQRFYRTELPAPEIA